MMFVETYEATEAYGEAGLDPEDREIAAALVSELGLDGQERFIGGGDDEDAKPAIPYRKMTKEEKAVYGVILANRVPLNKYADGPIPVRVLQVAAHAKEMFDHLYVWCPENADDPDPLLLGYNGEYPHSPAEIFMLARWGEVLEPMSVLREKAAEIAREQIIAKMESISAEVHSHLTALKAMTPKQVLAGDFRTPMFCK